MASGTTGLAPATTAQTQPNEASTTKSQTSVRLGGTYDPIAIQKEFDRLHATLNQILVESAAPAVQAQVASGATLAQTITALNQALTTINALTALLQEAGLLQSS